MIMELQAWNKARYHCKIVNRSIVRISDISFIIRAHPFIFDIIRIQGEYYY
jgi:hypothetical protein